MSNREPDALFEQRKMFHRVFVQHAEGAKVLEVLVGKYHDRTTYQAGGLEAQRETERRAAQKEVIEFILRQVAQITEGEFDDVEA
jgi:hypothetical protein